MQPSLGLKVLLELYLAKNVFVSFGSRVEETLPSGLTGQFIFLFAQTINVFLDVLNLVTKNTML